MTFIKLSDTRNPKSSNRYKINCEVISGLKDSKPISKETLSNTINNNINNINSNSSTKNFTFSIPALDDVLKYEKTFGENLYIDGYYFYYYNDKHNWKDNNGLQIRNWKALFNNWNQLQKQKAQAKEKADEELKKQASEKYEQLKAQNAKEQR